MNQFHRTTLTVFCAGLVFLVSVSSVHAQSTGASSSPTVASPAPAESKLASRFAAFAGSQENANALVSGLRHGQTITLQPPTVSPGGTPTGSATSFTPPTKPMGYGNVKIALSLAQNQLARQGITNPTPEQIQGVLMGTPASGTQGSTQGILQMRASGMGWGRIANSMGIKLGTVMSGKQIAPASTTSTSSASTHTTTRRVTTASGSSASGSSLAPKGKGIVTASGGTSQSNAAAKGQGSGSSGGIVSAVGNKGGGAAAGGGYGKGGKH